MMMTAHPLEATTLPQSPALAVFGVGQLASALLQGWHTGGQLNQFKSLVGVCHSQASATKQSQRLGFTVHDKTALLNPPSALQEADWWLLAVKPTQLPTLLPTLANTLLVRRANAGKPLPVILSLAAGFSIEQLQNGLHTALETKGVLPNALPIARVMGNTQWAVNAGVAAWCGNDAFHKQTQASATLTALLSAVGLCVEAQESQFDALTALAGSAPAFLLTLLEAFTDGAVASGLPRALSQQLVPALFAGVAKQVSTSHQHPAVLRDAIVTPAGTTAAGLQELESAAVRAAITKALLAATQRAEAYRKSL